MQGSARIDELRQKFHENPRRYFAPLANEYRKAGDPEQAIAICRAHLAQQPGHMSGHVVYAQALYDAGRVDESRVVFEKALSLDPDNAIVLRQLGDISRQRGDSAEARHWYSRALETDPHDREVAAYIAELTEPLTETDATPETKAATSEEPATENAVAEQGVEEQAIGEQPAVEDAAAEEEPVEVQPAEVEPVEVQPVETEATQVDPAPVGTAAADTEAPEPEAPVEETPLAWKLADEALDDRDGATSSTDNEVPLTAPAHEPEVPAHAAETVSESDDADVVATPLTSASPFVTRTMADLYARQGYHEQALEVYRELAAANPDDSDLADRINELSAVSKTSVSAVDLSAPDLSEQPPAETVSTDSESVNEFSEPVDLESEVGFESQDETAAPATDSETPSQSRHFTEGDLAEGDQWDTDPWGAGFSSADGGMVPFDFGLSNAGQGSSDADTLENPFGLKEGTERPVAESGSASEDPADDLEAAPIDAEPREFETPSPESIAAADVTIPPAAIADEELAPDPEVSQMDESTEEEFQVSESELSSASISLGVLNEAREEISVEEMFPGAPSSPASSDDEVSAASDEAVVAYSPQTPDEKDLPHYLPTGPTIREFFATLGAYRPSGLDAEPSFTARAVVPEIASAEQEESGVDEIWNPAAPESAGEPALERDAFPLASDAFASLFPDSPVSEEDSRAAFALSGALSSQPAASPRATPAKPVAPTVAEQPAPTSGEQESEEDIRRFREWLDGLADS